MLLSLARTRLNVALDVLDRIADLKVKQQAPAIEILTPTQSEMLSPLPQRQEKSVSKVFEPYKPILPTESGLLHRILRVLGMYRN
jgi:hypothetical protein